jgi:hypothetical protein
VVGIRVAATRKHFAVSLGSRDRSARNRRYTASAVGAFYAAAWSTWCRSIGARPAIEFCVRILLKRGCMSSRLVPLAFVILCACLFTPLAALAQDAKGPQASSTAAQKSPHPINACPITKPPETPFFPSGVQDRSSHGDFYFGTPKLSVYVLNNPSR